MEWKIQTAEEAAKAEEDYLASIPQDELDRIAWNEKHPRCEECGQFLRKRPPETNPLALRLGSDFEDLWYSHYVRDYWGEYDHR